MRQVIHALLTRPPLSHNRFLPEGIPWRCFVRLACVKHAASVHPEPGSNSQLRFVPGSFWLILLTFVFTALGCRTFSLPCRAFILPFFEFLLESFKDISLFSYQSSLFVAVQQLLHLTRCSIACQQLFYFLFVVLCDSSIILPCTRLFVNNFFHVFWLIAEKEGFEPSRRC